MKRYKVYTVNTITTDKVCIGEVWSQNDASALYKAHCIYDLKLEAYDEMVVERG